MFKTTTITIPQPFGEPLTITHDLNGVELFDGIGLLCHKDGRITAEAGGISPELAKAVAYV